MHDSYKEAVKLWSMNKGFWDLFKSTPEVNMVWQAMMEKVKELEDTQNNIINYSIDDMPYKKMILWEEIVVSGSINNTIISIPILLDGINNAINTYIEGTDYNVVGTPAAKSIDWLITPPTGIDGTYLWAPIVYYENELIEKYYNNGFLDLVLDNYSMEQRKHILRLAWFTVCSGPTKANISAVINALAGMPFMHYPGIVSFGTEVINMDYRLPINAIEIDSKCILYTSEVSVSGVSISDNIVTDASVEDGDVIEIDNTCYYVAEVRSSNKLIIPTIADGTYDINIYKRSSIKRELLQNGCLIDPDTGDIFNIIDGNVPEFGGIQKEYFIVHNFIARYAESTEKIDEYSELVGAPVNSYNGSVISTGSWLPAFHPIYDILQIYDWTQVTASESVTENIKNDLINYVYNEETRQMYHLADDYVDSSSIEIMSGEQDPLLVIGDTIDIITIERSIVDITALYQDDDDNWVIELIDTYDYAINDNFIVYQPDATHSRNIGALCVVVAGKYENDKYILTVNQDLSDVKVSYGTLGAKLERQSKLHNIRTIEDRVLQVLTLNGKITAKRDDFVIVMKSRSGSSFGAPNIANVSGISGDIITLSANHSDIEDYHYLILKDNINPAIVCEIETMDNLTDVRVVDDVVGDYDLSEDLKAIFIKTLPYHNGFIIKENPANLYSMVTLLASYPNFQSNIDKVLNRLLSSGCKYNWKI